MTTRIGAESKPPWRAVPRIVRQRVAELAGARVVRALRVWGGYAPSPTFRLFLDDRRRLFLKGTNRTSNEHMLRALAAEERVYRDLADWLHPWAPTIHGSFRELDWHVLLLEDVGPASFPPWTGAAIGQTLAGYAAFHQHSLGRALPEWLSRDRHHWFANTWTELAREPGGLAGMTSLAGPRASDALDWTRRALPHLRAAAEPLANAPAPSALLHFDSRSDNLRLQPGGRLRIFDWPYACVGPPELDLAAFAQSITCEGGPPPEELVAEYARHLPVRPDVMRSAVAAMAGYFAHHAWRDPIPGLPRVRMVQRRQLRSSLMWAAQRLQLPAPDWLDSVPLT